VVEEQPLHIRTEQELVVVPRGQYKEQEHRELELEAGLPVREPEEDRGWVPEQAKGWEDTGSAAEQQQSA
jgi:hypothetical protein